MNERKSVIYTPTRRDLLRLLPAAFLATCAPPTEATHTPGTQSPERTGNIPALTAVPTPQASVESKPSKTPSPEEILENQAKQVVFNAWTSLLSQERSDGTTFVGLTILKTQITNPDWQKNFPQILSANIHPTSEPLKTKWLATWFRKDSQYGVTGEKYYGEIEFNNIKLKTLGGPPTSDADKANGFTWAGGVTIDFITRRRAVFATTPFGWTPLSKEEALKRWLTDMDESFTQFSPWQPGQWGSILTQRNGQWERQSTAKGSSGGILGKFEIPSEFMYSFDCGNPNSSCKKIVAEIK